MIRLVIIEDQRIVQEALVAGIREYLTVELVRAFRTASQAVQEPAALLSAEIGLVDLHLGQEQAVDLIPEIRRVAPSLKLIWVTSVATEYLVHRALEANLEGFVHKDDPIAVLVTALERVAAGRRFLSETVRSMQDRFRRRPDYYAKLLSPRELDVLVLLSQGVTNEEVAAVLGLSPGTVQAHRRNIMTRLGVHNLAELQAYALKCGFTTPDRLGGASGETRPA